MFRHIGFNSVRLTCRFDVSRAGRCQQTGVHANIGEGEPCRRPGRVRPTRLPSQASSSYSPRSMRRPIIPSFSRLPLKVLVRGPFPPRTCSIRSSSFCSSPSPFACASVFGLPRCTMLLWSSRRESLDAAAQFYSDSAIRPGRRQSLSASRWSYWPFMCLSPLSCGYTC